MKLREAVSGLRQKGAQTLDAVDRDVRFFLVNLRVFEKRMWRRETPQGPMFWANVHQMCIPHPWPAKPVHPFYTDVDLALLVPPLPA